MFCPKCGYKNPDSANFCMKCGEKVSEIRAASESINARLREYHRQVPGKKGNIWIILIGVGVFLFIPMVVLFGFVWPIGVGFAWLLVMILIAVKTKVKQRVLSIVLFGVLCFLALMATVTDMYGNPGTNFVLKKMYFEENDELFIEKVVYHPQPGETSVEYYKYRITPTGEKIKIGAFKSICANAIFYFGIAVILMILNFFINYFRPEDIFASPTEEQMKNPIS